jgi:peptidyl-prolyl cis-trans isomerase C
MAEYPYLRLKVAQEIFGKAPGALDPAQRRRVDVVAVQRQRIEQCILSSPEAARITLPHTALTRAMTAIRARYASDEEFEGDLLSSGVDVAGLTEAIRRDLTVNLVLEQVARSAEAVSDTEAEIFYLLHRERFRTPEKRTLRHILITINAALPGSERLAAMERSQSLRARLHAAPKEFAAQAQKYSECPTALNGGLLGSVKAGDLYAELEPVAFSLPVGAISPVLESPMGFHLIQCVDATSAVDQPLSLVRERIRAHLDASRRTAVQKNWMAGLIKSTADPPGPEQEIALRKTA